MDLQLAPLAPEASPAATAPKLRVVCHPPLDGDPAGAIAYLFNQPMVDPQVARTIPPDLVRVTPPTPGLVAWLGDRTLVFTPRERFRFATAYQAVLSPSLASLSGHRLRRPMTTGFATRAVTLLETRPSPGEVVDPWPVFSLRFNQPVDPATVLAHLKLEGPRAPALRLDPRSGAEPQVVRVEPTSPLPPSARFRLHLRPGLPSPEGPLVGEQSFDVPFSVAGPQHLSEARCPQTPCLPADPVQIVVRGERPTERTCNALEITPLPRALRCQAQGDSLLVRARFLPGGLYLLRLSGDAPDVPPIPLPIGRPHQPLFPDRPLLVLRPGAPLRLATGRANGARVARVRPEMVIPILQAIAAPDALAPFPLSEEPILLTPSDREATLSLPAQGGSALWLVSLEGTWPQGAPPGRRAALVQVTSLGITLRYGWTSGVALVTGVDGAARSRVSLVIRDRHGAPLWRGKTSREGLAWFPGRGRLRGSTPHTLWAEADGDRTFVVLDGGGDDALRVPGYLPGQSIPTLEQLVGTVLTDRRRYLPGHRVRFFGVLRGQTRRPQGTLGHLPARHSEIAFRVTGPRDEEMASGRAPLGVAGLYTASFDLPSRAPEGHYTLWISLVSASRDLADWVLGSFQVVSANRGLRVILAHPEAPLGLQQANPMTLRLEGLGGRPVAGAALRWQLYRRQGAARPLGYPEFHFGTPQEAPQAMPPRTQDDSQEAVWVAEGQGLTDAQGAVTIAPVLAASPACDRATFELEVDAETLDGRHLRSIHRRVGLRVSTQLGIRVDRRIAQAGEPVEATVVVLDAQGLPVPKGPITVVARRDGVKGSSCELYPSLATDSCLLLLPAPGRWTLTAHHPDTLSASTTVIQAATQATVQPSGGTPPGPLEVLLSEEKLPAHRPMELLLWTPTAQGTALVTLEQDGLAWAVALPLQGHETRAVIPPGLAQPPTAWLTVTIVSPEQAPGEPLLSKRVALAVARTREPLDLRAVLPRDPPAPGEPFGLDLTVRDPHGDPTRAALFVHVYPASEAPAHPALDANLRRPQGPGLALRATEAHLVRSDPNPPEPGSHVGPVEEPSSEGRSPRPPEEASPPDEPGSFHGPLLTDDRGRLSLSVNLARRHRRHHLVVLAADPTHPGRFGRIHQVLQTPPALDLRVRTPPLLRLGDQARIPVTLHNRTPWPGRAVLRVRSTGSPVNPTHHVMELAAAGKGVAYLQLSADQPGLTRIQLGAHLGPHRSALERRVIVLEEHRASGLQDRMGRLRGTARLPVTAPSDPRSPGWLTLTLASSPYLACREILTRLALAERPTLAGTALGLLALGMLHEPAFRARLSPWLDEASFRALGTRALTQLRALRLPGGEFRRHPGGPPAPWRDVGLALLALEEAQASGLRVPRALSSAALDRLGALARNTVAPPDERTLALGLLKATRRFLRPDTLATLPGIRGALSPEARARLRWIGSEPGAPAAPSGPQTDAPNAETRALLLLALSERGIDPAAREAEAHLVFESLAGQESPWTMAWSLLALRAAAHRTSAPGAGGALSLWVDRRFLGNVDPVRGQSGPLHLTTPLIGGRTHEALLASPKTAWAYYHAHLQAPGDHHRAHQGVSLWATYELHPKAGSRRPPSAPHSKDQAAKTSTGQDLLTLAPGETAVGRITLVTTESQAEAVLRIPIPAGAEVVDAGRPGQAPDLSKPGGQRFPTLPVLEATLQGDALFLQLDSLPPGIHEHRWVIQATQEGRYRCETATLRRATDHRLQAVAKPCEALRIARSRYTGPLGP